MSNVVPVFGASIPFRGIASTSYTVRISGIAQFCIAGTLKLDLSIGRRSQASFTVHTDNLTHFQQAQPTTVFDASGAMVFSGYIMSIKESKPGFQPSLIHQISAVDQHYLADKKLIAKSYTEMSISAIVQDIVNTYLSSDGVILSKISAGLTPDATNVYPGPKLYPAGNDTIIPKATFAYCTIAEALDALATMASNAGTLYYWQIDQNKTLYFVPYDAIQNTNIVDGRFIDQVNNVATVQRGNPKYRNVQVLTGGLAQTSQQTETRPGDGSTKSWTMGYALFSEPTVTVTTQGQGNPVLQLVGLKGTSGAQFYWQQGDATITQEDSDQPLANTQTLQVSYIGQFSSIVGAINSGQIAAQKALNNTNGIVEALDSDTNLSDLNESVAESTKLLSRYGVPGVQLQFTTMQNGGWTPGQMIPVQLPDFALNSPMLIETVSIADSDTINIWYTVNAVLGPYDTTWTSFFSALVKNQHSASDISVGNATTQLLTPIIVITIVSTVVNFVGQSITPTANLTATPTPISGTVITTNFVAQVTTPAALLTATTAQSTGVITATTASFTSTISGVSASFSATANTVTSGVYPTFTGPNMCSGNFPSGSSYSITNKQPIRLIVFKDNDNLGLQNTNSYVYGGNVMMYWSDIETSDGNRDWTKLEAAIKLWSDNGKKAILRISTCGQRAWTQKYSSKQGTPQWVFDLGVKSYTDKGVVPAYWDPIFITKFKAFIAAFGKKYDGDPRIEFIQAAVGMGGECKPDTGHSLKTPADAGTTTLVNNLKGIGFTNDNWFSFCTNTVADAYATAFNKTPLAMQTAALFSTTYFTGTKHSEADIVNYVKNKGFGLQNDGIGGGSAGSTFTYTPPDSNWATSAFISAEQRDPTSQTKDNFECDMQAIINFCQKSPRIYALCFADDIKANTSIIQKYCSVN